MSSSLSQPRLLSADSGGNVRHLNSSVMSTETGTPTSNASNGARSVACRQAAISSSVKAADLLGGRPGTQQWRRRPDCEAIECLAPHLGPCTWCGNARLCFGFAPGDDGAIAKRG